MRDTAALLKPAFAPRLQISRLTLWLGVFVFLVGVVLNLILYIFLDSEVTLHATRLTLIGQAADDSWNPMHMALAVLNMATHPPLYTTVVFDYQAKFQYPLTSMLLVSPLMHLPYDPERSTRILNAISWFATVGTAVASGLILLRSIKLNFPQGVKIRPFDALALVGVGVAAAFTFFPLAKAFALGQIQTWIDFLFCLAVLAWLYGRKGLAGVLTAVICMIKPQLTLLVVWAALRKEWRYVWYLAIPYGVTFVISLLVYGLQDHWNYFEFLSYLSSHGETHYPNQSVNGLVNRLLHNGSNLFWLDDAFAPYNPWVHWSTLLSSTLIIAATLFWRMREHDRAPVTDFLIASLSFTVASPIAWEHHYGIMVPMFAAAIVPTLTSPRLGAWSVAALAISYFLSSNLWSVTNELADTPYNFLQSYLFFGALLLLCHLYRLRHVQYLDAGAPASAVGARPAPVKL